MIVLDSLIHVSTASVFDLLYRKCLGKIEVGPTQH